MAGSRLDKIGNIFSRATGLLRTGAIKYEDRPIWFDIYRIFPPKYEPRFNRDLVDKGDIRPIFYPEDHIRAEFAKRFGANAGGVVRDLKAVGQEDICQNFIESFNKVQKSNPGWTREQVFENVAESLTASTSIRRSSEEEERTRQINQRRINRRTNIVTTETLLSLFKESSEEAENNKSSKNKSNNNDTEGSESKRR